MGIPQNKSNKLKQNHIKYSISILNKMFLVINYNQMVIYICFLLFLYISSINFDQFFVNSIVQTYLMIFKQQGMGNASFKETLKDPLIAEAIKLFKEKNFEQTVPLCQRYIESHAHENIEIDGLGNNELSIGYYEWFIPQWYCQGIEKGKYKGTAYDILSLCYLSLKGKDQFIEPGIKWYRSLISVHPNNINLKLGLANILGGKSIYEQALQEYNKVFAARPNWPRPLECIAYIYQYKRIEKPKAIETANKIIQIDPNNRVGLFVLARNQKNADTKIEKLKIVSELHPKYARAINQIGIVYGGTKKQYDLAIDWYKKCTEVAPQYASCYNNIGVNYELKKEYPMAIQWYFKAIEKDKEYKAPHKNASDIFDELNYSDQQIEAQMSKYNICNDYFYYYMGLSYYDKKKYEISIKYYMKAYEHAKELSKEIHKLHNSTGITYDQMRNNDQALNYYNKCITANPNYHSAYYNMAIVYKRINKTDDAIQWYKKAIDINPRYSYAYNNLGNIYKNMRNYEEAIKCYKKAIEFLSTYTLALANLGVCYLKLSNYRDAFNAMARAKEILATDNNNLSESNKSFLKETLDQFDKEGEIWRQNGFVTNQLKSQVENYESAFKQLYTNNEKEPVNAEKVMKKEILQILDLILLDQFWLTSIDPIYDLVHKIFQDNEEYFHILPQIFVQFFYKTALKQKMSMLDAENKVSGIIKGFLNKLSSEQTFGGDEFYQERNLESVNWKYFDPNFSVKPNIFREGIVFQEYADVYNELMRVNDLTKESYKDFKFIVDQVRKQSHGIPYGVQVKIPTSQEFQFPVLLSIFETIFQGEIKSTRMNTIIQEIFSFASGKLEAKESLSLKDIQHFAKKSWAGQISAILQKRKLQKKETVCEVGDLLKGKIIFQCVDHIKKALTVADQLCYNKGHKITRLQSYLCDRTQEVILNIKVKQIVCELKLSLKQEQTQLHFINCLEEISNSPLGCIFNCCLSLCKEVNYPLLRNCQDIVETVMNGEAQSDKQILEAALFVIESLNESQFTPK